ncbi:hypothetical protein [Bradyrhizobium brasilense]
MIEKNYQPADIEHRMARIWEESGAFKAAGLNARTPRLSPL